MDPSSPIELKGPSAQVARILVVEDERIVAMGLRNQLRRLGYEVVGTVTSGEQAIQKVEEQIPDLVLMDIRLEGEMDGIEAARTIRERFDIPVVYLTAYSGGDILERAKITEPYGYILKPYEDRDLHVVIETALYKHHAEKDLREKQRSSRKALGEALQRERAIARTLAESFLGSPPTGIPGLRFETAYEPASSAELIGGDFFDFIELGANRLGLFIGDVCGKGLPAALLTASCRHMLRAYALEDASPETVVRRLNRALCHQASEECTFVTLIYGVLHLATFDFAYANAGHCPAVLCAPNHARCTALDATGGLLGIEPSWRWASERVQIEPGGLLTLFTDGILEARREGEMFGLAGVEAAVCDLAGAPANVASGLNERARAFAGHDLNDDVAVVVVRRSAALQQLAA